jgi:ribosomal-protein-alanine N-acetyltransferase
MMLRAKRKVRIDTERMVLRPPVHADFRAWAHLRRDSMTFLSPWEPTWATDHLTRKAFTNRVYWAQRSVSNGSALPMFLMDRSTDTLLGAITLDNIRRGSAKAMRDQDT